MSTTAARIIAAARAEIGYHEGRSGGHWNNVEKYAAQVPGLGWANGQPWCDTFVAWCFVEANALPCLVGGPTASVARSRDNAKKAGRFSEYPAVGAQAIFGRNGDAHTGIVVAYGPTTITTVEGNTNTNGSPEGDGVYLKTHDRRDPWVYGYLYPDYPEGIDSADPKWAHAKPTATPAAYHPHASRSRGAAADAVIADARKIKGGPVRQSVKAAILKAAKRMPFVPTRKNPKRSA